MRACNNAGVFTLKELYILLGHQFEAEMLLSATHGITRPRYSEGQLGGDVGEKADCVSPRQDLIASNSHVRPDVLDGSEQFHR